jgi:hypothetical protein
MMTRDESVTYGIPALGPYNGVQKGVESFESSGES